MTDTAKKSLFGMGAIACFVILAAGGTLAQTTPSPLDLDYWMAKGMVRPEGLAVEAVDGTFAQSSELNIKRVGTVISLAISGHAELRTPTSLIRVILVDINSDEYLVYEAYPLAQPGLRFDFSNACRETCISRGIPVESLKIELIDAFVRIDQMTTGGAAAASSQTLPAVDASKEGEIRSLQNREIIRQLNANIKKKGLRWKAGETAISSLSYAEKKRLLGKDGEPTVPNLQGFDYYVGGIFELVPPGDAQSSVYEAGESAFVDSFDWRSRHGANDPESPYYDGDPAGSGWITSVKLQLCGDCWAHCALGAVEAQANLYFNQHLDLDLSEQHIVSCAGCGTCGGGNPGCALAFVQSDGVIDEACFPESGTDESCANQCAEPDERIRINELDGAGRTDDELRRWLLDHGPFTFGIISWYHCMLLVGYQTDIDSSIIWIVKNSWGESWGEDGYGLLKVPVDDRYLKYGVKNPVYSDLKTYDVACYDHDGDGYSNWGSGLQRPASCPTTEPERDCNDSDPRLGPVEANGSCRPIDGPPPPRIRIEAENMGLDGYRVEVLDFASGGALINLKGSDGNGSATLAFPGDTGQYDIFVVYHDENDGVAQLTVSVAGVSVDSWVLDQRIPDGQQPEVFNRFSRQVAADYTVNNSDEIRIDGLRGNWDQANVDYIEFVLRQPLPPAGRIEAEDMRLDGYRVEALGFASGGALINLKGSDGSGSATAQFAGASGQYDIIVVYHDENDGVAQLSVSIAGVSVDSWALDQRIPDGQQPEVFNRFSRQVAADYTVNNGDEIRIDGLRGNWDQANVDYIEFVLKEPSPPAGRIEAEDMRLDGYRLEALDFASGGALINLKGDAVNGSATTQFSGASAEYDVIVVYHDENDGVAQLTVSIAGVSVDSWALDQRIPDGQQPEEFNRFSRQVATDYTVNNGDQIRIDGLQGNWDNANVDYIEFVHSQPPPSGRIEAEDMLLDGYRVEALGFASGGALINLKGPAVNGSATAQFAGVSGQYDVIVVYHDENDGVAQLTVSIAGVSVDSWILDERIKDGQQPEEFNRFTRQVATSYTLNSGDEIRIDGLQGNWDHANVDYIEFLAVP